MTYTIELSPEEEKIVDRRASRLGVTPQEYVRHALGRPLRVGRSSSLRLNDDEQQALSQMNARLPLSFWERYAELTNALRSETLTEAEKVELGQLAAQEEAWTGERLQLLQQMAQSRNASLLHFMKYNDTGHHPDASRILTES